MLLNVLLLIKKYLRTLLFFLFIFSNFIFGQNQISGIVQTENGLRIPNVMLVNVATGAKSYSNGIGEFFIGANVGEAVRVLKDNYDRQTITASLNGNFVVTLIKTTEEIEEVTVSNIKITGHIDDASKLKVDDSAERLQNAIGTPKPPEKPREKAPELKKDVLMPMLFGALNVDGLYKVVSGKSRQMKSLYRYEDSQDDLAWIRTRIDDSYFKSAEIPEDQINSFLNFIMIDADVRRYVKARNEGGLVVTMEKYIPEFLKRIKKD